MTSFIASRPIVLALSGQMGLNASSEYTETTNYSTGFTLTGSDVGLTGAAVTYTVAPDPAGTELQSNISVLCYEDPTPPSVPLLRATLNFATGDTSTDSQTFTITRVTDGTSTVSISSSLAEVGSPISLTTSGGAVAWFQPPTDGGTLSTSANTTTQIAAIPLTASYYYSSPDLLPGQTLSASGTALNIVGDSTVPTVSASDSAGANILNTISDRDVFIEVMDSPLATIYNRTAGTTWGKNHNGTTWYDCIQAAADGHTIEITPGAINATTADAPYGGCGMFIYRSVTIQRVTASGVPSRGRWRLYPLGYSPGSGYDGILVASPIAYGRKTVLIEGFDITDQWGTAANGVQMSETSTADWSGYHQSITLQNFKVGRTSGATTGHGLSSGAEVLNLYDGHVFDVGDGSGQNHNMYLSAKTLTMRGVRTQRSRGWSGTPYSSTATLEGHMAKLSAVTGVIEGCCFDAAALADHSEVLQMKAGGNWTVRGNLFIDSQAPNVANGAINMCREYAVDGVTPNFEWWAGSEGNSLLFERNVYIGHYPRPIIWFFTAGNQRLYGTAAGQPANVTLQSLTVRDNIAMLTPTQVTGYYPPITGFPGTNNSMWINNDPNNGTYWTARGNSVMTYGTNEPGFSADDKALKLYRRQAGTIAANGGTVSTYRFTWPHGSMARSDAVQGLG